MNVFEQQKNKLNTILNNDWTGLELIKELLDKTKFNYQCEICKKWFKNKSAITNHIKLCDKYDNI